MNAAAFSKEEINPLQSIEEWEDDVLARYPEEGKPAKSKEEFRNYDNPERDTVREFYRLNHKYQTYDFVMEKRDEFLQFNRKKMRVWEAMEYLNKQDAKLITIHLGNGCSMAAVKNGRSVDTSMGFAPLNGLIMGTRSGDIDPSIIFHLINQLAYDPEQVNTLLNKRSGMLGLTGFSDMRDIGKAVQEGNKDAELALEMYAYRVKKYVGSYAAVLNGLDAIVFTAGVGENDVHTRRKICSEMEFLGINLDDEKNKIRSTETREINNVDSPVKILVVPTNEELEIAKQCYMLLRAN